MNEATNVPPRDVPTLTEVVPRSGAAAAPAMHADPAPTGATVVPLRRIEEAAVPAAEAAGFSDADQAALVQKVLHDVQRQVGRMFEYRLRDALAPVVSQAMDRLVAETRETLSGTLQDVVQRAVAQAIARERNR